MPRNVPTGLLSSPTQCTAVLIQRADGVTYGLSDSEMPFTYNGQLYQNIQGATASNIHQEAGTSIDNLEVTTILNDALAYVKSQDMRGRRFENSVWTLFQIDYLNPSNGPAILGVYRLGRATLNNTMIKLELMGLLSYLQVLTGMVLQPYCDVLRFGNKRCDPGQTIRTALSASLTVGAVVSLFVTDFFGDTRPALFYNFGDATWSSGQNDLLEDRIKVHTVLTPAAYAGGTTYNLGDYATSGGATYISIQSSNTGHSPASSPAWWLTVAGNPASVARITWRTPPSYPVAVGDVATLCFGCDRRKATCARVPNTNESNGYNNFNFKGVYSPDPDQILLVGR